jgi:hypothetical protein
MPGHPSKKHDQHLGFASLCSGGAVAAKTNPSLTMRALAERSPVENRELARHLFYKTAFKLACDGCVELIRIL